MWDHLALLGPRRWSAHPRLERVCSLSVCLLFRLSRFVPDFNVSGKTAEPKMAFNFAHLLSAACGGAPRRLGRLRRPWARCARLFWGGYQHRKIARFSIFGGLLISSHDRVRRVYRRFAHRRDRWRHGPGCAWGGSATLWESPGAAPPVSLPLVDFLGGDLPEAPRQ